MASVANPAQQHQKTSGTVSVAAIGNLSVDIMLDVKRMPSKAGDHVALRRGATVRCGGSFNCLISASRAGACAAPVGFLDSLSCQTDCKARPALWSAILLEEAERNNLLTSAMVPRDGESISTCAILTDPNGQHTFLSTSEEPQQQGHGNRKMMSKLPDPMRKVLCESRFVILDGYAFVTDPDLIHSFLSFVKAGLCKSYLQIWVDPQAVGSALVESSPLFRQALQMAHGVCFTNHEGLQLARMETASVDEFVRSLRSTYATSATTFVAKLGARGCALATTAQDGSWHISHVEGFKVDHVADTVGCGDAFLGAFLAAQDGHGLGLEQAAVLGNAVGAATAERRGAGESGIASWQDTCRKLRQTQNGQMILDRLAVPS